MGTALRMVAIGQVPPGLYHDEAQHGLDALHVLDGHIPLYFTANNGREPLFIYLVTLAVAVLGRTPLAIRLPACFVGILTLAATYRLAYALWGHNAGRYALGVLTFTFWHVHLSRTGFRAVLLPLFTALYLAKAAEGLRTGQHRAWIVAGALYGVSWYTYMAVRFTPVALAVMLFYGLRYHRAATHQAWRGGLSFCTAALIVLMPLGIYTLQHPDIVLSRSGQVTITHPEINQGDFWGTLVQHTLRTASMFFVRGDRIWRHNLAWRPVWKPALGLACLIGLAVALSRLRHDPGAALALLWTGVMALPTLLAEDAPHFLRAVGVLPTAALLPTLGLMWIASDLPLHLARHAKKFTLDLLHFVPALLVLVSGLATTYDYFVRFATAPLAYHWFEAGPVALATQINHLRSEGWDGERMLHTAMTHKTIYMDSQLWAAWSAIPFLVPEHTLNFMPPHAAPALQDGLIFIVWPYRHWDASVLPYLPHPAYLSVVEGPQAQGDKDSTSFTTAMIIQANPRPALPEVVGHFEKGILLRAALVKPQAEGVVARLWWESTMPVTAPYTVFVHYLREGVPLAQHDGQPGLGHLSTTFWQPGDLILDVHPLPDVIPDSARDQLRIGLYHSETVEGLLVLDAQEQPVGDWVTLGVILEP